MVKFRPGADMSRAYTCVLPLMVSAGTGRRDGTEMEKGRHKHHDCHSEILILKESMYVYDLPSRVADIIGADAIFVAALWLGRGLFMARKRSVGCGVHPCLAWRNCYYCRCVALPILYVGMDVMTDGHGDVGCRRQCYCCDGRVMSLTFARLSRKTVVTCYCIMLHLHGPFLDAKGRMQERDTRLVQVELRSNQLGKQRLGDAAASHTESIRQRLPALTATQLSTLIHSAPVIDKTHSHIALRHCLTLHAPLPIHTSPACLPSHYPLLSIHPSILVIPCHQHARVPLINWQGSRCKLSNPSPVRLSGFQRKRAIVARLGATSPPTSNS